MRAADADGSSVPLDAGSAMLAQAVQVHFALLFTGPAARMEPADLSAAFAKILPSFKTLAGRLLKGASGGVEVLCNNAGVPLSHVTIKGAPPRFNGLVDGEFFDLVGPNIVGTDQPVMRVRLTDFTGGFAPDGPPRPPSQVLAISLNHGLCDAVGIGMFLNAWADAYRGGSGERDVSHERLAHVPPSPGFGEPPLSSSEGIPDVFRELHHAPDSVPALPVEPMQRPVHACIVKAAEEIAGLKSVCDEVAGGDGGASGCGLMSGVSTNDVTCAELVCALGLQAERVPVSMVIEYRGLVGAPNVFSNVWTTAEFYPRNSLAAAADIRKLVKHAQTKEFLEWHLGQSMNGMNMAWKPKIFMNTWMKAFKLSDLTFAAPCVDVSLGAPMMEARAAGTVPQGCCYCIVLPQTDGGLKAHAIMPEAAAERIREVGAEVTTSPVGGSA